MNFKEKDMVNKWKVFIPRAGSGSDSFPHSILGKPFVGEPNSISSWTYNHIGPFASREETENVIYISCRLFRFLVCYINLHKMQQRVCIHLFPCRISQNLGQMKSCIKNIK